MVKRRKGPNTRSLHLVLAGFGVQFHAVARSRARKCYGRAVAHWAANPPKENVFEFFGFLSTKCVAKSSFFRNPANKDIMK